MSDIIMKPATKILYMYHMRGSALSFSGETKMVELDFMERGGHKLYFNQIMQAVNFLQM